MNERLILASASQVRARLLQQAGIAFDVISSDVDEQPIKQALEHEPAESVAQVLATAKAMVVSEVQPDAYVIGADQILECEGQLFDKPPTLDAAKDHLRQLRGRTHRLLTACIVFRNDAVLWSQLETPALTMRSFSDSFIEDYIDHVGEAALSSVGAYQLEGEGAQLFERVDGDFFSILGLPLLPLLAFLRGHGLAAD